MRMGVSLSKLIVFLALLSLFLLLFVDELKTVEAGCTKRCRSKTWSGWCGNSDGCSDQCKNLENACFGACHWQGPGMACFCYYLDGQKCP